MPWRRIRIFRESYLCGCRTGPVECSIKRTEVVHEHFLGNNLALSEKMVLRIEQIRAKEAALVVRFFGLHRW